MWNKLLLDSYKNEYLFMNRVLYLVTRLLPVKENFLCRPMFKVCYFLLELMSEHAPDNFKTKVISSQKVTSYITIYRKLFSKKIDP